MAGERGSVAVLQHSFHFTFCSLCGVNELYILKYPLVFKKKTTQ